jgi:hypothetical protein
MWINKEYNCIINYIEILRQFKIGPFAIFDTAISYLGFYLLSPLLTKLFSFVHLAIPRSSWLWLTLPIAILFHLAFNQNTPLMKIISDPTQIPFYIAIAILLVITYLGLKNIKIIN